jgi:hypothetical protein
MQENNLSYSPYGKFNSCEFPAGSEETSGAKKSLILPRTVETLGKINL